MAGEGGKAAGAVVLEVGAIAVFVKTPGLSPIKTRLAKGIGAKAAEEFYRRSVAAVAAVVKEAERRTLAKPYWAVAEDLARAQGKWGGFDLVSQGDGSLGERLNYVYRQLLSRHPWVIFLGGDCPQMPPSALEKAAAKLAQPGFVLGPSRDGGFYLFGGNQLVPRKDWTEVSYSQTDTAQMLAQRISRIGPLSYLNSELDVDEEKDLIALQKELTGRPLLVAQKKLINYRPEGS